MSTILDPPEFVSPQWELEPGKIKYVHDWRAYINDGLRQIWASFTDEQKRTIAENAQEIANEEVWD